jgi:hypothetical protein
MELLPLLVRHPIPRTGDALRDEDAYVMTRQAWQM